MDAEGFDIKCPNCRTLADLEENSYSSHVCKECGNEYLLSEHLCPHCFTYSTDARTSCINCGSALSQQCSRCGSANWSGHPNCYSCGQPLDIFALITARHASDSTVKRLDAQMKQAKILKTIEDVQSQKRMREFETIEDKRKEKIERRDRVQRKRERRLLLFSGVVLLAFVTALMIYALLQFIG